MKKYDAFQLKLFMALLMVLDHLPHIPGLIFPTWVGIFHLMTRCVGAWFAFMAVEGFLHTHNRAKYNIRLFLWAGIMFAGNSLLTYLFRSKDVYVSNNIFLTLAIGVLLLNMWAYGGSSLSVGHKVLKLSGMATITVVGAVYAEGGYVLLPFMLMTYGFRNRQKLRNISYILFSLLLLLPNLPIVFQYDSLKIGLDMFLFNSDWFFLSVLPFIYLYNGKRGRKDWFAKYFFYWFYPLHLWAIAAISYLL